MKSLVTALGLSVLLSWSAGCGGHNVWGIVRQSNPNGLAGKKAFAVAAWSWDGLVIGTREEDKMTLDQYVAKKKAEDQAKWRQDFTTDQQGTEQKFREILGNGCKKAGADCAATATDAMQVRVHVRVYEPGFWSPAGFGNRATHIRTTVEFTDAAGNTLDEVKFGAVVHPGTFTPSTGQRMRIAAENIANQVSRYLKERTAAN